MVVALLSVLQNISQDHSFPFYLLRNARSIFANNDQAITNGVVGFMDAVDQSLSGELVVVVTFLPWCRSCHHVSWLPS